jgi:Spy/CpxP family protein refolding chaperone
MKTNAKVILIAAAALIMLPAMALAMAPQDPATAAPPTPMMGPQGEHPQHPLADVQAFKDEMARHKEAVQGIMAPLKDIREKMAAEIKALHEQYFPKPAEGARPVRPEPGQFQEFIGKVHEIVQKYQADNEATLKDVAGKLFDERIVHQTAMLKIEQDNKDIIVNAHYKRLLVPEKMLRNIRDRFMRMRGKFGPGPEGPMPPTAAPVPAPAE